MRTGYKFFPYAARQSDQWWVLRMNFGFPEHDMYTLFVDAEAVADITANPRHPAALVRSIPTRDAPRPELDEATAASVVGSVARYVTYGSESGDPCDFCSHDGEGMTRS